MIFAIALVVIDTDGSTFITKAEFDSLKNNFQAQIDNYNSSIDSKIDGAIAAYLTGIKMSTSEQVDCIVGQDTCFALYNEDDLPTFNNSADDYGKWVENSNYFFSFIVEGVNPVLKPIYGNGGWTYDQISGGIQYQDTDIYSAGTMNMGAQNICWTVNKSFNSTELSFLDRLATVNTITAKRSGGFRPTASIGWGQAVGNHSSAIWDSNHGSKVSFHWANPPEFIAQSGTSIDAYTWTNGNYVHRYTVAEVCDEDWRGGSSYSGLAVLAWDRLESGRQSYEALFSKKINLPVNKWNADGCLSLKYGSGVRDDVLTFCRVMDQGINSFVSGDKHAYYITAILTHIAKCNTESKENSALYNELLTTLINSPVRTTDGIPVFSVKKSGLLHFVVRKTQLNADGDALISISDGPFGEDGLTGGNKIMLSLSSDLSGSSQELVIPKNTWCDVYIRLDTVPTNILYFQGQDITTGGNYGAIFEFKNAELIVEN